jgi:hypothetical protein
MNICDIARGVCVDGAVSGRREPSTRISAKHLKLLPSEVTRLRWFYGGCVSRGARGSCRRGLADSAFDLQPYPEPTPDRRLPFVVTRRLSIRRPFCSIKHTATPIARLRTLRRCSRRGLSPRPELENNQNPQQKYAARHGVFEPPCHLICRLSVSNAAEELRKSSPAHRDGIFRSRSGTRSRRRRD